MEMEESSEYLSIPTGYIHSRERTVYGAQHTAYEAAFAKISYIYVMGLDRGWAAIRVRARSLSRAPCLRLSRVSYSCVLAKQHQKARKKNYRAPFCLTHLTPSHTFYDVSTWRSGTRLPSQIVFSLSLIRLHSRIAIFRPARCIITLWLTGWIPRIHPPKRSTNERTHAFTRTCDPPSHSWWWPARYYVRIYSTVPLRRPIHLLSTTFQSFLALYTGTYYYERWT